jgi:hypothetical protein
VAMARSLTQVSVPLAMPLRDQHEVET